MRIHILTLPALAVMYYIEGKYPFLLFVLAAVIHECGHILAIRSVKGRIRRVDIMPLGACIVTDGGMSHKADIRIFLWGPAANGGSIFDPP